MNTLKKLISDPTVQKAALSLVLAALAALGYHVAAAP